MEAGRALCLLCRVGDERLALRAADVLKVVGGARLCRLPRLPPQVAGITHNRGRIVTVFDSAVLLFGAAHAHAALTPRTAAAAVDARVVVLDRGQRHLALAVDGVDEIETLRLGRDLPAGPTPAVRVAEHRGKAVFAVDADRLVESMLAASDAA
jgi:chemotaxis signal transduction protein